MVQVVEASRNWFSSPDVLVVDDDEALREGLIDLFRLEGVSAVGAESGAEALFLLRAGLHPGVILLDLDMPVMSGWDFVRALEHHPALLRIPIAIVSGITSGRDIPPREADAGFFKKPVNFDALLAAVDQRLPHRGVPRS